MNEREARSAAASVKEVSATAVEAAKQLSGTAVDEAGQVAQVAKDEAREVVRAVGTQGRQVVDQVRASAREQVDRETERLADAVRELAEGVRALVEGRPEEAGAVKDFLQRAVDGLESASQAVRERGAQGVLETVTSLGRRRPGAFLATAALVGFGTSRVARAAKGGDEQDAWSTSATQRTISITDDVDGEDTADDLGAGAVHAPEVDGLATGTGGPIAPSRGPGRR